MVCTNKVSNQSNSLSVTLITHPVSSPENELWVVPRSIECTFLSLSLTHTHMHIFRPAPSTKSHRPSPPNLSDVSQPQVLPHPVRPQPQAPPTADESAADLAELVSKILATSRRVAGAVRELLTGQTASHHQELCSAVTSCLKTRLAWSNLQLIRDVTYVLETQGWQKIVDEEDASDNEAPGSASEHESSRDPIVRLAEEHFRVPLEGAGVDFRMSLTRFFFMQPSSSLYPP